MKKIWLLACCFLLVSCGSVSVDDYAAEQPVLNLESYFSRPVQAWGMFQDRSGKAAGSRHLPQVHDKAATFAPVGRPMVAASDEESAVNPRARSAKLRAGERTGAPAGTDDLSIFNLPNLASLEKMGS